MVMITAITPSLKASMRLVPMAFNLYQISRSFSWNTLASKKSPDSL
jgi:hypothetical protein